MDVASLPRVDEHSVVVPASAEAVWDAALDVVRGLSGGPAGLVARALGCDPSGVHGWGAEVEGATVPGFRVVEARRPDRLVLAGRHRFSRYAIVLRVETVGGGARCRLESRAAFPGLHGRLYRLAVISSRGHVLAVRRLLHQVAAAASR